MAQTLRPQERIRSKNDFRFLYKRGNRFKGKFFILVYFSNELGYSRLAVVVKKEIGNAVQRNRIKRRMRALFRTNKDRLSKSFDLIFLIRPSIRDADWTELRAETLDALHRLR